MIALFWGMKEHFCFQKQNARKNTYMNLNDMGNKENNKVKIRNYAVMDRKFCGKHKHRSKRWTGGGDFGITY
jgi:hypothetical protein